ncbi:hypothetical protein HU200_010261 [Digitaria exilis]|uniref:Uncharacterized protein n=1 Tax=Digitaria exilis TaxID=1010633 RepID=A0A835KNG6_9POAL|nr:hypothetical protein HU200_010261 [Digitaria exilis]
MGERAELHVQLRLAWVRLLLLLMTSDKHMLENCLTKLKLELTPSCSCTSIGSEHKVIYLPIEVGGRSSVFVDAQKSLPVVSNKPTIIFGVDVVASQDWHEVLKELLHGFAKESNMKPQQLIFYRTLCNNHFFSTHGNLYTIMISHKSPTLYGKSHRTRLFPNSPPVHYAHKLAHRARLYLAQGSEAATTVSSGGATAPTGGSKQIPEIKDALKRSMFYC